MCADSSANLDCDCNIDRHIYSKRGSWSGFTSAKWQHFVCSGTIIKQISYFSPPDVILAQSENLCMSVQQSSLPSRFLSGRLSSVLQDPVETLLHRLECVLAAPLHVQTGQKQPNQLRSVCRLRQSGWEVTPRSNVVLAYQQSVVQDSLL